MKNKEINSKNENLEMINDSSINNENLKKNDKLILKKQKKLKKLEEKELKKTKDDQSLKISNSQNLEISSKKEIIKSYLIIFFSVFFIFYFASLGNLVSNGDLTKHYFGESFLVMMLP